MTLFNSVPLASLQNGVIYAAELAEVHGKLTTISVPVVGASVFVYTHNTTSPQVLVFQDEQLTLPLAQPLLTDGLGRVPGIVADQQTLDLVVSHPSLGPTPVTLVVNAVDGASAGTGAGGLKVANSLSEIQAAGSASQQAARANLGLGSAATHPSTDFDPAGAAAAAITTAEAASDAAGAAAFVAGASVQKVNNLSDVFSASASRTNLGLHSAAVADVSASPGDFQQNGAPAAGSTGRVADAGHVHPSDTSRAPLASPTFTGTPAAPTVTARDQTTKLATTAYADNAINASVGYAPTQDANLTPQLVLSTPWGITAGGQPYYDPAGASPGEEAVIEIDPSTGAPTLVPVSSTFVIPSSGGGGGTDNDSAFLQIANNLSDLASASAARTSLGLGSAATAASTSFLSSASNLADLPNASTARTNLGLGSAATHPSTDFDPAGAAAAAITTAEAASDAAGAAAFVAGASVQKVNNLSDVFSASASRSNLGLGAAAQSNVVPSATVYAAAGSFTYTIPSGATMLEIICVGSGGGGGGAGSAAAAQLNAGGGGGAQAASSSQIVPVGGNTTLAVVVAAGGAGGPGGAAAGAAGTTGTHGVASTVTGTGISVQAFGGSGGIASGASSTTIVAGGVWGGLGSGAGSAGSGTTANSMPGNGGASAAAGFGPMSGYQGGSGGGGGAATATIGGNGGNSGVSTGGGGLSSSGPTSPNSNGANGVTATANGAGGGGGGGGAAGTGTGGTGGTGGPGMVIIKVIG